MVFVPVSILLAGFLPILRWSNVAFTNGARFPTFSPCLLKSGFVALLFHGAGGFFFSSSCISPFFSPYSIVVYKYVDVFSCYGVVSGVEEFFLITRPLQGL